MRDGVSDGAGGHVRAGPTRRTRVGSIDAYAADVTFGSRTLLREFRFAHDGQRWGIGVLVPQGDVVPLRGVARSATRRPALRPDRAGEALVRDITRGGHDGGGAAS